MGDEMTTSAGPARRWDQQFRTECRRRGLRFVAEHGFIADEVYLSSLSVAVRVVADARVVRVEWMAQTKPLVLDDILWAAFMPDADLGGPRKRLNVRIYGVFTVSPLDIGAGTMEVPVSDEPAPHLAAVIGEFERVHARFIAEHSTMADFLTAVRAADTPPDPDQRRLREIVALIAADRREEAVAIADAELAQGNHGPMWSSPAGVYEWLSLYCKPPEVMAAFRASLVPTHARQVIAETSHSSLMGLARPRHHGMFLQQLRRFDGSDVWAMILSPLPSGSRSRPLSERASAATEYLQAAGRADAMTMEIRKRGGQDWGASWVRYVIGHPHRGPAVLDVAITLPRSTEMIARSEVFDADEAATLFDAYYQTGNVPAEYTLRPVEGYTEDDGYIDPPAR